MKTKNYEELARVSAALSSPVRLLIVDTLAQGPRGVEALSAALSQSVANTSRHLQIMKRARVVFATRHGRSITYALAPGVAAVFAALRRLGTLQLAALPEVRSEISREALIAGLSSGQLQLLDVRPASEFAAGHLPGARSVPLGALDAHLEHLDPSREVIATCRGPWCVFAAEAVARLRAGGFQARTYTDGVSEWLLDGGTLEVA